MSEEKHDENQMIDIEASRAQFPNLYRVMQCIKEHEALHNRLVVPQSWGDKLVNIEQSLSQMTLMELVDFCTAEDSVLEALIEHYGAQEAHDLMNGFFDDWVAG